MKMRYLLACILVLDAVSIMGQTTDTVKEIRVDPLYVRSGAASLFFKKINFVPLETNKSSYFGQIDKLVVTEKYFIIHDKETDAILLFRKDGGFHVKIGGIPGITKKKESNQAKASNVFESFSVDFINNRILVKSIYTPGKIHLFDFQAIYLKQHYLVPKKTSDFIYLGQNMIATRPTRPTIFETREGKRVFNEHGYESNSVLIVRRDSSISNRFLAINNKTAPMENESLGDYRNFSFSNGRVFFTRFFDYHIYEISEKGIERTYKLLFPIKKSLPNNFYFDSVESRKDYFDQFGIYYSVENVYNYRNLFSFSLSAFGSVMENKGNLLYNESTGNSIFLGGVAKDTLSYFLNPTTLTSTIHTVYDNCFYTSISSFEMHNSKTQSKRKIFNAVLDKYFNNSSPRSNPVIVELYPKEMF